jgi:hypothetical protein
VTSGERFLAGWNEATKMADALSKADSQPVNLSNEIVIGHSAFHENAQILMKSTLFILHFRSPMLENR